ncbi:MAG: PilZ domain-containing protein [Rhodospirillales bacterium]
MANAAVVAKPANSSAAETAIGPVEPPPPGKAELRRNPRFSVLWTGRIDVSSEWVECAILNISADGAKLRFFKDIHLPKNFSVSVDRYGVFPAELAWRDGHSAGVRFLGDIAPIAQAIAQALPTGR